MKKWLAQHPAVKNLCFDSRSVNSESLFFAIRGSSVDAHKFLPEVCAKNPVGVVIESTTHLPKGFTGKVILVPNAREALDEAASAFYGEPSKKLKVVGVTGTNGKTTTTNIIEYLCNFAAAPCGVMGTIDHHLQKHTWATGVTTPDPVTLQARIKEMVGLGAKVLAMEVSSHALDQARVDSVEFDGAIFTNLSRDHLDYHHSMDEYFAAKLKLFSERLPKSAKLLKWAAVNGDDEYGLKIESKVKPITYGQGAKNNLRMTSLVFDFSGTEFELSFQGKRHKVKSSLIGEFNVYNTAAAMLATSQLLNLDLAMLAPVMANFPGVSGRLERIAAPHFSVFVDYAHTDGALTSVLASLQAVRSKAAAKGRIITVFGCGGDRDQGKRPLMMRAALDGSDLVFVTSDNPRHEDPKKIIQDSMSAVKPEEKSKVVVEVDREQAIAKAMMEAKSGDAILIAGKGHESYQQIGIEKRPFSDQAVVRKILG